MDLCIHHNDADGKCAAAIVLRKYPAAICHSTDYKDPLPETGLITGKDVIIVDFSYKPDQMKILCNLAKSVTWVDHHATAKDYPYQYLPGLRCFEDKKFAGCELTWIYLYPGIHTPLVVSLIGDYDKWALLIPESKVFHEGLKILDISPSSTIWNSLFNENAIQDVINKGKTAISYRDNYCKNLRASFGYATNIDGHRAYACNMYMFGSQGFGTIFDVYPICIAYIHTGISYVVSLYSKDVDVGVIAQKFGGGGHKGAAGFTCKVLPWIAK